MKKTIILFIIISSIFISGCSQTVAAAAASATLPAQTTSPTMASVCPALAQPDATQSAPESDTAVAANAFFFTNIVPMSYKAVFYFNEAGETEAVLQIHKIEDLAEGTVYELKLDAIPGIPEDRLSLGYFYVLADKIYKTAPTRDSLDTLKYGELPCPCLIVCQEQEARDAFEGEPGFHQYITVDGHKREFHSYNDETATGYYESFTWERGKGLVAYRSGYGAERDSIQLQLND